MSAATEVAVALKKAFPGLRVTSTDRTRKEQDALIASGATKATNSQHLSGNGLDIVLPKGVSTGTVRKWLVDNGHSPGEFIDEKGGPGDGTAPHVHIGLEPKGGGPASGSGPASQVAQWRQRNAGPDPSQFPDIRDVLKSKLKQSTPIPPDVIQAYNSHKMSDEDRAIVDKYVKSGEWFVPRGQALKVPPPRTQAEMLGMGMRDVLTGAGGLADIVLGPVNALVNALPGEQGLSTTPARDAATGISNALGLAKPESPAEQLASSAVEGGTAGLASAGVGALAAGAGGVTGTLGRALASNPLLDTLSGATSGVAQETARQAGATPAVQLAAGLAGGLAPVGAAGVAERMATRRPRTLAESVADTPKAAAIDEAGNLTPEGREIATRHNVAPAEVKAAYEAPPSAKRAVANDQEMPAVAKEATNDQPAAPAPEAQAPAGPPKPPVAASEPAPASAPPESAPQPASAPSNEAQARLANAGEFGIPLTRGEALKNFDIQDREQRLLNSNGPEAEKFRQWHGDRAEKIAQASNEFQKAFTDKDLSVDQRGAQVQQAIQDLHEQGKEGVRALYRSARAIPGSDTKLPTDQIVEAADHLILETPMEQASKDALERAMAKYGLLGSKVENYGRYSSVVTDDGRKIRILGKPEPLSLNNAEDFRQALNAAYDQGAGLMSQAVRALDDTVDEAIKGLAESGERNAAFKEARKAHQQVKQTFESSDVVADIAGWKNGAKNVTTKLKPEQVLQRSLSSISDLKRIKAVLLNKATPSSKAAWRAIQAHGLSEIFTKATTRTTNVAGEIAEAISGAKLRSAIQSFGPDKLKVMLDPDDFNRLMKLRRAIEDATVPIKGTTNPSGSGNLIMRLVNDMDNKVRGAFSAAGFAVAGPPGAMVGGAIGNSIAPAIKAAKESAAARETLSEATGYTAEKAATNTGSKPASPTSKAASAAKRAALRTVGEFVEIYSSPRVIAPVLAASEGEQK